MSAITRKNRRLTIALAFSLGVLFPIRAVYAGPLTVSPPRDELAMIIASSTGNLAAVKRLVSNGMDLDHSDFTGNTPLIYAARYARVPLVEYLLRHGADVNAYTHWGTTALIEAVRKGSFQVVQDLLDAGADVDQLNNKHESALFDAVKYRRLWAVNMLLYRNARTDIKNTLGYTPLAYALEEHQTQIVTALQQRGVADRLAVRDDMPALTAAAADDSSASHPASRHISSVSLLR
jgi:ankyrin repeat protein